MKFELLEVAGTHIFSMKAMTLVLFFIFAIIVVGYLVGKISIKGVSLGSAAIFLVALVAGHFKGRCVSRHCLLAGEPAGSRPLF